MGKMLNDTQAIYAVSTTKLIPSIHIVYNIGYELIIHTRYKERNKMFRVILKDKFKEKPINLSRVIRIMYTQELSGSIRKEHIEWWKRYWIKPIYLEILYPKKGWITLVKVFREGKPSIRVITTPTSSSGRELLVLNKLYGEEEYREQKSKKKLEQFRNKQKNSKTISIT